MAILEGGDPLPPLPGQWVLKFFIFLLTYREDDLSSSKMSGHRYLYDK